MKINKNMLKQLVQEEFQIMQEQADPVGTLTNLVASIKASLEGTLNNLKRGDTSRATVDIETVLGDIDDVSRALNLPGDYEGPA